MSSKIIAIVGSYRPGGVTERAVAAILEGAREKGAETQTIRLTEQQIEFCTNCRQCTQALGPERGKCAQHDGMEAILQTIESASAVVLAAPVNYYNVTAIFRRFQERLLGYTYWPWGQMSPKARKKQPLRRAALVSVAGMPGFCIPLFTSAASALRLTAKMLGAKPVASLWIGPAAMKPQYLLSARNCQRARRIGWKLAQSL